MTFRRVPVIPPGVQTPRPPSTYDAESGYFGFPKPGSATIVPVNVPPCTARIRLTVARPAIVILHGSITGQMLGTNDEWQGYYGPEISTGPFLDPVQSVFPLIGGRAAWLFAPGAWIIDVVNNSGTAVESIDYDTLYIDDPTVARTLLEMISSENQPSQSYNHVTVVVVAATSTPFENQDVLLQARGLIVQNIGANPVDITMDGAAGTGNRGIRIAAGAEKEFFGARYCFTQFVAFSTAGTTLRANLALPGWRTF